MGGGKAGVDVGRVTNSQIFLSLARIVKEYPLQRRLEVHEEGHRIKNGYR